MNTSRITNQGLLEEVIQSMQDAHKIHLVDPIEGKIRVENVILLVSLEPLGINIEADVILTVPSITRQIGNQHATEYFTNEPMYAHIVNELSEVSNLATFQFRNLVVPGESLGSIHVKLIGNQPVTLILTITGFAVAADGVQHN